MALGECFLRTGGKKADLNNWLRLNRHPVADPVFSNSPPPKKKHLLTSYFYIVQGFFLQGIMSFFFKLSWSNIVTVRDQFALHAKMFFKKSL